MQHKILNPIKLEIASSKGETMTICLHVHMWLLELMTTVKPRCGVTDNISALDLVLLELRYINLHFLP